MFKKRNTSRKEMKKSLDYKEKKERRKKNIDKNGNKKELLK